MPERRRAHRLEVHLPVRYCSDAVTLAGVASSLSRGGMFLRTDFLDGRGQAAAVSLSLPGDPAPLELAGVVVRVDEGSASPGLAIRFAGLTEPARRRLANFMIERSYQARQ
jgi:uncharacterized protein (TIGR02266 family)